MVSMEEQQRGITPSWELVAVVEFELQANVHHTDHPIEGGLRSLSAGEGHNKILSRASLHVMCG